MSFNYDYVVQKLEEIKADTAEGDTPLFLDFGCGAGQIMEKALEKGLDIHGADAYPEGHDTKFHRMQETRPELAKRIHRTENNTLPFEDNQFDAVVSNMVFEHVPEPEKPYEEIARVLKPGGLFLTLFPTSGCLYEGHAKVYLAHKMKPMSEFQYKYLKIMQAMGLAKKTDKSPEDWARYMQNYLHSYCFYHDMDYMHSLYYRSFGEPPERWESDYMLFRLNKSQKLQKLAPAFDNPPGRFFLKQLCHLRATDVFAIRKKAA